jgi:Icc-related predicted phosphoesterase
MKEDTCFFVSDLHGNQASYQKLLEQIERKRPGAVFFGGDLLPSDVLHDPGPPPPPFLGKFILPQFRDLRRRMGDAYPDMFIIFGNDDPRDAEEFFTAQDKDGLWHYINERSCRMGDFTLTGYAHVPPTPFLLKDWERYDVSRYVDPGCIHPTEGFRTVPSPVDIEFATMANDLEHLSAGLDPEHAVFLFHAPPYQTFLDRASLDGVMIDHVPADVHVGSIAIKRFIEQWQPLLTLHGHIHESSRITGQWKQRLGRTWSLSAAWEGPGLALVTFRLSCPGSAERLIL